VRTQLVDGLLADLLQDVRFLRLYYTFNCKSFGHNVKTLTSFILSYFSAYHGHTSLLTDLSTYKQKQMNKTCDKDYVHVIPAPDPYRGKYRGYNEETGVKYANEVKETIENAHSKGRKVSISSVIFERQFFFNITYLR
jgi:4-aminobutyrate aminotransferase-like enzyme